MDNSDNTYIYRAPRPGTYNQMSSPAPIGNTSPYSEPATSFEAALDRIRDQVATREVRSNLDTDLEPLENEGAEELELDSDEELESGLSQQVSERPMAANTEVLASAKLKATGMKDLLESAMSDSAASNIEGGLSGIPLGAPAVLSEVTPALATSGANLQGPLTAESVTSLMLRLERTAGAHNGQWNFGVLGNQAGVTALQLQRSVQGGWRVRVSFDESAQLDEKMHAEALKTSLIENGHRVDSVTFAPATGELTLND